MHQLPLFDLPPLRRHARLPAAPRPAPLVAAAPVAIWDAVPPRDLLRVEGRGRPSLRPVGMPAALWGLWRKHAERQPEDRDDPAALEAFCAANRDRVRQLRSRHGWDLERMLPPDPRPDWRRVLPLRLMPAEIRAAWRERIASKAPEHAGYRLQERGRDDDGLYKLLPPPQPRKKPC